jgi:two-component sensor histidine kinase
MLGFIFCFASSAFSKTDTENKVKIACVMDNVDVDTAVPIRFIVNKQLTNALKYTFLKDTEGQIEISLAKSNINTLTLKVADNGFDKQQGLASRGTGFGTLLVSLLTQQLNRKIQEEIKNGTSVFFQFKMDSAA